MMTSVTTRKIEPITMPAMAPPLTAARSRGCQHGASSFEEERTFALGELLLLVPARVCRCLRLGLDERY